MVAGTPAVPAAISRKGFSSLARAALLAALAMNGCRCSSEPAAPAAPPDPSLTESHQGVWGSGPKDVWAVGPHGALAHYDGKQWKAQPSGTIKNLVSVSGAAADDVWAVGEDGVTLHYDGKQWKQTDIQDGRTLLAVWSVARNEAWAAGIDDNVGLLRYYHEPKGWENLNIGAANSLWRAWASGPKDVWMVGADNKNKGFVLHGDGKNFDRFAFEGETLRAVAGTGPNDVWTATYDGSLHHWDGAKWSESMKLPNAHWLNMWSFGEHDVWAVGFEGAVYHYDGTKWSRVESGSKEILWSAWGSAPNDLWIVGNAGAILHWDGKALAKQ